MGVERLPSAFSWSVLIAFGKELYCRCGHLAHLPDMFAAGLAGRDVGLLAIRECEHSFPPGVL